LEGCGDEVTGDVEPFGERFREGLDVGFRGGGRVGSYGKIVGWDVFLGCGGDFNLEDLSASAPSLFNLRLRVGEYTFRPSL